MRRIAFIITILATVLIGYRAFAALTLGQKLAGRILRQVQANNALWYVSPVNFQRYWLGDADRAPVVLGKVSLAVSQAALDAIPTHGDGTTGIAAVRTKLAGRIIRLGGTRDLWYVSPLTKEKYPLGDDPLSVIQPMGLGITNTNIQAIPVAFGYDAPKVPINGLLRTQTNIATPLGTFLVDLATLDLDATSLKVMTDTAQTTNCKTGCAVLPLKTYSDRRHAVFALHGSYFCPAEYASCVGQTGYYFYPVLNSFVRVMINADRMKYTTEPLVTFDFANTPHFYHKAMDFLGKNLFAAVNISDLQAAISNGPALMENGKNVADPNQMDTKQRTVKSYRGAFGWKDRTLYFFVVRGATVTDSAAVAQAMGLEYALNLDGGGSTAMMDNGSYVLGPGRNLPNAIVLTR